MCDRLLTICWDREGMQQPASMGTMQSRSQCIRKTRGPLYPQETPMKLTKIKFTAPTMMIVMTTRPVLTSGLTTPKRDKLHYTNEDE